MNVMHRIYDLLEIKLAGLETDEMTFSGYGAVFGNQDAWGDVIEPGAFAETLVDARKNKGQWPAMLLQHGGWGGGVEDMTPIGIWTELAEDGKGLKVTGKLADITRGQEAYTLMKMKPRPAITGLSIGYIPKEFENGTKPSEPRRRLKKVELVEISLVTFPANPKARIGQVKSINDLSAIADVEVYLRDAGGFSRREAKALVAQIKALDQWDAGDDGLVELAASITRNIHTLRK